MNAVVHDTSLKDMVDAIALKKVGVVVVRDHKIPVDHIQDGQIIYMRHSFFKKLLNKLESKGKY